MSKQIKTATVLILFLLIITAILIASPAAGAASFSYQNGTYYDSSGFPTNLSSDGYLTMRVGDTFRIYLPNRYESISENQWGATDKTVVSMEYYSGQNYCTVTALKAGISTVTGWVQSFVMGQPIGTNNWGYTMYSDPIYDNQRESFKLRVTSGGSSSSSSGSSSGSSSSSSSSGSSNAAKPVVKRLSAPRITKAVNLAAGTRITWSKVSGASKYRVYVKSGSKWVNLGNTAATSYTYKKVKSGKIYTFAIRALSAKGAKYHSAVSAARSCKFLARPKITGFSDTKSGTKIVWKKVAGASKYRVFVKSGSSWKKLGDTKANYLIHRGIKDGAAYTYTVRALVTSGAAHSAYYTTGWAHRYNSPVTYPVPKIIKTELTPIGIRLYWSDVKAPRYRVLIKSGGKWKKLHDTTKTSFYHHTLQSGKSYTYSVICLSANGKKFKSGYNKTGKTVQYLSQPKIQPLTNVGYGIKITWNKVPGAVKYRVFTKVGSSWRKLADTASTSYTHNGLTNLTVHSYTVACLSADSTRLTSSYHATGRSRTFKATPQITSITNTGSGILIKWKAVPGITKYRLYHSEPPEYYDYGDDYRDWYIVTDTYSTSAVASLNYSEDIFAVRGISEDGKTFLTYRNNVGWRYPFP